MNTDKLPSSHLGLKDIKRIHSLKVPLVVDGGTALVDLKHFCDSLLQYDGFEETKHILEAGRERSSVPCSVIIIPCYWQFPSWSSHGDRSVLISKEISLVLTSSQRNPGHITRGPVYASISRALRDSFIVTEQINLFTSP